MKLLVIIHSLQAGGAERVAARLATHYATAGWSVEIATFEAIGSDFYPLDRRVKRHAFALAGDSESPLTGLARNAQRILAIRRRIRDVRPDAVLSMMTSANVLVALASLGLRVRVVGSERVHPPRMPTSRMWQRLRAMTYRYLDVLVALDGVTARWLMRHTSARRTVVIPNPAAWPLPCTPPLRDPAGFVADGRQVLLAVGRLTEQKGFDRLIDAFARIASHHPGWDLAIVGEGELRDALCAQVAERGLAGRVVLPGLAGNIGDWYARAAVYVLSSRFEGFPNTLVEAMAAGVPVIAFDCETGPADIVRHDVDGVLVSEGDVPALATALDRLMGSAPLRVALGARAADARDRFSTERVMRMWTDVLAPPTGASRGGMRDARDCHAEVSS